MELEDTEVESAPTPMSLEDKQLAFSKELDSLLEKYDFRLNVSAVLQPASTDGTLGIKPVLSLVPNEQTTRSNV